MYKFICFLILSLSFHALNTNAQSGQLDFDFSTNGKFDVDINSNSDIITDMALQNDGKIVMAGYSYDGNTENFLLMRFTWDGNLDASFGDNGLDTFDFGNTMDNAFSIAIQPDGKILAAGFSYNSLMQYKTSLLRVNTDGTPDNTFGTEGKAESIWQLGEINIFAITLLNDGNILIGGHANGDFLIIKYLPNGMVDTTFGNYGVILTDFDNTAEYIRSLAIQPDGKILAAGNSTFGSGDYNFALARYLPNGTLDNTFSYDGIVTTSMGTINDNLWEMKLQTDGKIVVAGTVKYNNKNCIGVARYLSNGILDLTFNNSGRFVKEPDQNSAVYDLIVQTDGKIIVGGYNNDIVNLHDFSLFRLKSNGTPDSTFGNNGLVMTDFYGKNDRIIALALQNDGRIVAAGDIVKNLDSDIGVARYISDINFGIIGSKEENSSLLIYPNPVSEKLTLSYNLPQNAKVSISLTDMNGRIVQQLANNEERAAGQHNDTFALNNDLVSGYYILSLQNGKNKKNINIIIK